MARLDARTTVTLTLVAAASIVIGVLGAVRGMPASYGLTTEQAAAIVGPRSVWWTLGWVLWSVALTAGAFWRAWWMKLQKPHVRFTAGRGALWLFGAIGMPWVYPSLAWDLPLYDVYGDSSPRSEVSIVSAIAMLWWLGPCIALPVAAVWSAIVAFREARNADAAPQQSAPAPGQNGRMTSAPEILELLAFAAEPGGGNPAGVVLDGRDLDAAQMQRIATDLGHPETAFVGERDGRRVAVRYFSPGAEVPFCGHATIATAVALAEAEGVGPFRFDTAAGTVEVSTDRDAEGRITAGFTSVDPSTTDLEADVADRLLGILGLRSDDLDERMPLAQAFAGNLHPVVAIASRETFDSFAFDPAELRMLMDERGWKGTVITVHVDDDLVDGLVAEARNLFPVGDITEDPATGSAAASLGAYLRDRLGLAAPFAFTVRQGRHIGRPSVLEVEVPVSGGILVRGTATPL